MRYGDKVAGYPGEFIPVPSGHYGGIGSSAGQAFQAQQIEAQMKTQEMGSPFPGIGSFAQDTKVNAETINSRLKDIAYKLGVQFPPSPVDAEKRAESSDVLSTVRAAVDQQCETFTLLDMIAKVL